MRRSLPVLLVVVLGLAGPVAPAHAAEPDTTPPVVTFGPGSTSLTATRSVSFSEPVNGVSSDTVYLEVKDTEARVPQRLACLDGTGARVACTDDDVRGALVTPDGPLVPGEEYRLRVEVVTDHAGNAGGSAIGINATGSVPEDSPAVTPAWRKVPSSRAQGGSYAVSGTRLASARYAFSGDRVVWYGMTGPRYGTADVYVDSAFVRRVTFYAPADGTTYKVFNGLGAGRHTLKIVVRGERGSPNGTGTLVSVDAIKAGSTTTASPSLRYTWGRRYSPSTSYGRYAVENAAGATYRLTFRGTGVQWETMLGPDMGLAKITVDGVDKGVVDLWAAENNPFDPVRINGLTDAVHTLTITVLGRARPGAKGTYVAVDQFGVA